MTNPLHFGSADHSVQKTGQGAAVSGQVKTPAAPAARQWWVGDRLAYLVITVAVGIGITVFFALSKVTDITAQSDLLIMSFLVAMTFLGLLLFFVLVQRVQQFVHINVVVG